MKSPMRFALLMVAMLALLLFLSCVAGLARGGGGGGGHGGGGGGHSSGGGTGGGGYGGGGYYGGGYHSGYYGGSGYGPSTPLTPEQRARQRRMMIYGAAGVGAAGIGGGAIWWSMTGIDLVCLAFVLRRKRDYVGALDRLIQDTNFDDDFSRSQLLTNVVALLAAEDIENGYVAKRMLKMNSDNAAGQARAFDQQHQSLAEVKLDYAEGEVATAAAERTAPTTEDDRCVLNLMVTTKRWLTRRIKPGHDKEAIAALRVLDGAVATGVDGLWAFYVPALEEPLPSALAHIMLGNFHACDTSWHPTNVAPVAPGEVPASA